MCKNISVKNSNARLWVMRGMPPGAGQPPGMMGPRGMPAQAGMQTQQFQMRVSTL